MSTSPLYAGFRAALAAVSPRPDKVFWMGEVMLDEHTEPALSERFSALSWINPTIGGGGPIEERGFYAVTVSEPVVNGAADIYRLLAHQDAVLSAFRPGTTIQDGQDNPASILSVEIAGPLRLPTTVQFTLSFRWDRFPPNA